eukprot:CAMPEP_0194187404 /NCGR_PEP_ID=MMETSP0154-20130528/50744_1 /TAXON_ID=1049557 /ORGANISM="Thalassiothrix antarctica, Strain L6-D1" /LENGTH=177 /DNA_ID=CAMNT_0038907089 /DNA_START=170 /DNA_END=703 /DNA_ORIENTATION=-
MSSNNRKVEEELINDNTIVDVQEKNEKNSSLRRQILITSLGLLSLNKSSACWAASGSGAGLAAPPVIPSPVKPTGEMAKVCNVVALGREDVCLDPKLLPSMYDKVLIERAVNSLDDDNIVLKKVLQSVADADWEQCEKQLNILSSSFSVSKKVKNACKNEDGPTAAKIVLDLAKKYK